MRRFILLLATLLACFGCGGCGGFAARRLAQAPNTYPKWLAPKAPVTLEFSDKLLTVFSNRFVEIEEPAARLRYRVIEPGNYEFGWTNRFVDSGKQLTLSFAAKIDKLESRTNSWTRDPRGTVLLLHGYGVSGFAMLPWAFLLAQEGWRCVLVDLRGHGKSTGEQFYFGVHEAPDVIQLIDVLERAGKLSNPLAAVGHSFGAVLALRLLQDDPRVERAVAMAPYSDLSRAVLGVRNEYARWVPRWFIEAGLRKLPKLVGAEEGQLDPAEWLRPSEGTLFVLAGEDGIATPDQVVELNRLSGDGNELLRVPGAIHEALPFYLDELAQPVTSWLAR